MEPGIYGTDGTDPEEASGVLEPEDTLEDTHGVRDVLDTGWSPPEKPWAVNDWGTTEAEESAGESLDGRLARELPDRRDDEGDGLGDASDTDGELLDDEVGDVRAGPARRLRRRRVRRTHDDELWARDEGIDGAAASAEEAAVHIVRDARLAFPRMGKPVLLSVDDDPGVSRAVARDLRRRYGEEFRVLRAASGDEALEALRELKLRGRPGRRAAGRLPDAADERHRVPRAGDGPVPAGPPGAADRLRRHRRRHPGDQRRRRRLLPAQAVGPAGGEALPGRRRHDRVLAGQPRRRGRRTSS